MTGTYCCNTYPPGDGDVPLGDEHEMPQHGLSLDKSQPDVGGLDPPLQHLAGEDVLRGGAALEQRHKHFSVLDGQNLGELRGADDLVRREKGVINSPTIYSSM